MKMNHKPALAVPGRRQLKRSTVCAAALLAFAAGSLITARLVRPDPVKADGDRVFELMIYHTIPGKATALEDLFRGDSKLMAKHGIEVVGFWVPNEDPEWKDTFVYVAAFPSRDEAKKRWRELHADPEAQRYVELAKPIIEKVNGQFHVDEVFMRPSDFSAVR